MSISRRASASPLLPQALKSGPLPPKVPAPKLKADTFSPDDPSRLYSIVQAPRWFCFSSEPGVCASLLRGRWCRPHLGCRSHEGTSFVS
jgi:hypothetical protein